MIVVMTIKVSVFRLSSFHGYAVYIELLEARSRRVDCKPGMCHT